jgi:Domain of unknown function (DUF4387)
MSIKGDNIMPTIHDIAYYVRSKNAGPFWMTIDIFCDTPERFNQLKESKAIQQDSIAQIYHVTAGEVKIFYVANLNVIKISLPRPYTQGGIYERDMHCGQQYIQILDLEL